jgi:hypothetical protein
MADKLEVFYAVTQTSLYRIRCEIDSEGIPQGEPEVKKIAQSKESGIKVGDCLAKGRFVGVLKICICRYNDRRAEEHNKPTNAESIQLTYWGGQTSAVAGLFLKREDALDCLKVVSRQPVDPRWKRETLETIAAIGDDHPVFIVSQGRFGFNYLE